MQHALTASAWKSALAAVASTVATSAEHAEAQAERVRGLIATAPSRAAQNRAYDVLGRIQSAWEFQTLMAAVADGSAVVR